MRLASQRGLYGAAVLLNGLVRRMGAPFAQRQSSSTAPNPLKVSRCVAVLLPCRVRCPAGGPQQTLLEGAPFWGPQETVRAPVVWGPTSHMGAPCKGTACTTCLDASLPRGAPLRLRAPGRPMRGFKAHQETAMQVSCCQRMREEQTRRGAAKLMVQSLGEGPRSQMPQMPTQQQGTAPRSCNCSCP